jgi:uncharacterized protein YggE
MSRSTVVLLAGAMLLLVGTQVFSQVQTIQEQVIRPLLTVRGHAEMATPPDIAVVRMGAVVQQAQADVAQSQVNQIMQRAMLAIGKTGLSASEIQTAGVSLAPVYTTAPPPGTTQTLLEPRIAAYRASNAVEVHVENLQLVGQVIDAAVAAGANQLEDLSFRIKDDNQVRQQALFQAARQARAKAQTIAEALGVKIIGVQQIQEAGVEIVRPTTFGRQAMAVVETAAPTPVQPGEVRVEANVVVTYQIDGASGFERTMPTATAPSSQP